MIQYFDDIQLITAGIHKNYRGHIGERSPRNFSVELMASGSMYFQKKPGRKHTFRTPVLRWQAPGNVYNYGPADDGGGWEHYFILFGGNRGEKLWKDGFSRLSENPFITIRRVDLFRGLFTAVYHALLHKSTNSAAGIIYLEHILVHASEEITGSAVSSRYSRQLDRICSQIHLEPEKDFSLQELARSAGLSYSHFRKCFSEYTGVTPHQYILKARLRAASERLCCTDDPIKRIAHDLNLGTPSQFSKTFRRFFGMPPGVYRKTEIDV